MAKTQIKPLLRKSKETSTEPPGALPIIGDLHLLKGQIPAGAIADKQVPIFKSRQTSTHCFLLLYASFKMRTSQTKNSKKKANVDKYGVPEPSRALPIIGHLHLLGSHGQTPVFRVLGAMADKCGPIYSLTMGKHRILVLSSWELVKECFSATNDRIFANRPSLAVGKYLFYDNAAFAFSPYGQYWRDVRKFATLNLLSSQRVE
ncbi:Cytochrome P450 82C4 [Morus notabilis]|uniref:Cytochrome P450 82C4 n=1 Tax=Morus notabilis TaxID=981085 RepID=W9S2M6_9ROSA|nr:Cytochrome P450 82C4 [Morus notabilis]